MESDDVWAVVTLAEGSLCAGSHIDVYRDGLFWEAVIVSVSQRRFHFRYLHTSEDIRRTGWVKRKHFMASWRFPVRAHSDMWKAELVANVIFS